MTQNPRKRTFDLIKNDLYCPWYFENLKPRDWNLDKFDEAYAKHAKVNKDISHSHFSSDLNTMQESFPDDSDIKNHINKLRKDLEKSKSKKSSNYAFWVMKNLEQEREINEARIRNAEQVVEIEKLKFKATIIQEASGSREGGKKVEALETNIVDVIQSKAIEYHNSLLHNKPLTSRERKIMSNGLSSILDLNDSSINSQRSLFENDQKWEDLKKSFAKKHGINATGIPSFLLSSWRIIIGSIRKSGDLKKGLKYINNIYYNVIEDDQYILDIFSHFIKMIKNYPEYLSKQNDLEILENDYIRVLWSPLFEALFINHYSESCNKFTTQNKTSVYNEADKVIGFKIDLRIVLNYQKVDYDLVCGEAACHAGDLKVITDEGKLTREGKDIQDQMVKLNCGESFPWLIQLVGHSLDFSTIHLSSPGLYVNVPRFSGCLPSSVSELEANVPSLIEILLTFRSYVIDAADNFKSSLDLKMNTTSSLMKGRNMNNKISEKEYWIRPTYYTPPNNHSSKIPYDLNGIIPPGNITDKLLKVSYLSDADFTSAADLNEICDFEWLRRDGRFFNVYSKEYSDDHPCCP